MIVVGMCKLLRQELRFSNIRLHHHDTRAFYTSQWRCIPHPVYCVFRLSLALYTFITLLAYYINYEEISLIYFTIWSYTLLTMHEVVAAVMCCVYYKNVTKSAAISQSPTYDPPPPEPIFTTENEEPYLDRIREENTTNNKKISKQTSKMSAKRQISKQTSTMSARRQSTPPSPTFTESTTSAISKISQIPQDNQYENDLDDAYQKTSTETPHQNPQKISKQTPHTSGAPADPRQPPSLPLHLQLSWLLCITSSLAAPIVTGIYWVFLHEGEITIHGINTHMLNLVFALCDHAVAAWPVRLWHMVYCGLYATAYLTFTAIYWGIDHNNVVYNILDLNHPETAAAYSVALMFVGMPLVHTAWWGLYRGKLWMKDRFNV